MYIIPIIALIAATSFASAALYITFVEHPARLTLDDASALAQWKPSYDRALPIQGSLAILGGLVGAIMSYHSADWRWLAGSIVLLANWPFTLLMIMPINKHHENLFKTSPPNATSATTVKKVKPDVMTVRDRV